MKQLEYLMESAITALKDNRVQEAYAAVLSAAELAPSAPYVEYLRGICLMKLGRLAEARAALENELRAAPANDDARELLQVLNAGSAPFSRSPAERPAVALHDSGRTPPAATEEQGGSLLFVHVGSDGNAALAAGMLPLIKTHRPQTAVHVICPKPMTEFYTVLPFVTSVLGFDLQQLVDDERYRQAFVTRAQGLGADFVINSAYPRDPVSDFLAINAAQKERWAFDGRHTYSDESLYQTHTRCYTRTLPADGGAQPRYQLLLEELGIKGKRLTPLLWPSRDDAVFADAVCTVNELQKELTIAVFGDGEAPLKFYPPLGKILNAICRQKNFKVVAVGSAGEWTACQAVLNEVATPTLNLCGKLTLQQIGAMLKQCRLAVGCEGTMTHVACAAGIPSLLIAGGGESCRPYSPLAAVVCRPIDCCGCRWRCKFGEFHCLTGIKPQLVAAAIERLLGESSLEPRVFIERTTDASADGPSLQPFYGQHDMNLISIDC